jgi:hypothetical protein
MQIPRVSCAAAILLAFVCGLTGCGFSPDGPAMRKARETSAFAELRKFSTAQNILFMESGRFARDLEELASFGEGLIDQRLQQASSRASNPTPRNGYFFSEIAPQTPMQAGLAAYPETPGKTGDKVIMILLDEALGPEPTEGYPVSGDNSRIFFAQAKDIKLPFTHWPSEAELARNWKEIRQRSPQEGLREAQQIFDDFASGKPPAKDSVFAD